MAAPGAPTVPNLPAILYGTAWKEQATERLVLAAWEAGFRGFDTANQRKHYFEQAVGQALAAKLAGGAKRDELFIQTKFTFRDGQDHRLPYDPHAAVADQVRQSVRSSLEHLQVEWIDSLVLHGPSQRDGLGTADREAWQAMEGLCDTGTISRLGVSNVTAEQLAELVGFARIAPTFVQNRCYADRGWDRQVRQLCSRHHIIYQGFSLLTANRMVLAHPTVVAIAKDHRRTPAQIVFRFSQQLGMLPLTGTSSVEHMRQDLAIGDIELTGTELATIEHAGEA
ncbi:MAG: aldo/keto reductase family protein [Kofleriaceae bacterium]